LSAITPNVIGLTQRLMLVKGRFTLSNYLKISVPLKSG
jgi:hypothetical protein